eukprot:2930971-Pleurochrysis_carterae.AAC.1
MSVEASALIDASDAVLPCILSIGNRMGQIHADITLARGRGDAVATRGRAALRGGGTGNCGHVAVDPA